MNEKEEKQYIRGKIRAYQTMIFDCQRALDGLGVKLKTVKEFDKERADTISLLRMHCAEYGDNDWPDDLHLSDIIDKHLINYIERTT